MTENNPSAHVSRFTSHASSLDPFFNPAGVAVIGASANTSKLSHGILRNLVSFGYRGAVYPVNPGRSEILGLPCYPTITVVPDSGTGDLAGLTGSMAIRIEAGGKHFYDFDYELPAAGD